MKKIVFFTVLMTLVPGICIQAQDVQSSIDEARTSYQSGNLENARFALQRALNEINQVIGNEILAVLPAEMNGMTTDRESENVTGASSGFAGLYVSREYTGESSTASVEIVSDSPFLASLNAIMAMPTFMGGDQNQKRIKVGSYKALLTSETDDEGLVSYDIQVPFSNLLLTFRCSGIRDEDKVVGMANGLPVEQIVRLAQ